MSAADKSQNTSSTTPISGSLNASTGSSKVLKENQKQNTPSSPKKSVEQTQPSPKQPSPKQPSPKQPSPKQPSPKQPSPKQPSPKQPSPKQPSPNQMPNLQIMPQPAGPRAAYLDAVGKVIPQLYYNQPFFTRRPNIVSRDTVLPNLDADADNEYLFLPVHGEIGRRLRGGELVKAPQNSHGINKIVEQDEQRQINHYLRIIEISTPHESFCPLDKKALVSKIHDKLTSSNKKRFFSTSSVGKQERRNFFKEIKMFLFTPNTKLDTVHLVDVTHDRKFCGHIDIVNLYRNTPATFPLVGGMDYMTLLKPVRPAEFDQNPNITDIEKDALETFKLYEDSQWLGAPDGANFERISLFDNILSLAQHMNKRLNIVIFSCSGPLDPFDANHPSSQPYYYRHDAALLSDHKGSMYVEPIKILKTGCEFINRLESILYNIMSGEFDYLIKTTQQNHPYYLNDEVSIKKLYNTISGIINHLFSKSLLQTINTTEYGFNYLFYDLLLLSHNGTSIFTSRLDVDDFELLLFSTKIYLSEEIFKQLNGLIENVINFIDTELKLKSDYIIYHKSTPIWQKSLPALGLSDQEFNGQSYPNFFSSVGNAVEYLFGHLYAFKTNYLEPLLYSLNDIKTKIDAVQSSLTNSKSRSGVANTIGYKAVKLANKQKIVFENLVKKHCSHHYKYKSRTANDGIVKNKSTRSYRPDSMRRKGIGKVRNDTDPLSPTSATIRDAEEKRMAHPLYAKNDTISRNKRVKKALQQLNEPLNDKIIRVVGDDKKDRKMSQGRIERNNPGGVFMANRLNAFKEMLSNETRKKRVFSRSRGSRKSRKRNVRSV
jgi:hypothetical protein